MITYQRGFLNPQLESGPYATAYMNSIQAELGIASSGIYPPSKHYAMMDYMYNLSIDSANSSALEPIGSGMLSYIGQLIGYPWPSVFSADFGNNFQFIAASAFPGTNPYIGFSNAASGINYGLLTSANPSQVGTYSSVTVYRQMLKFVAYIKWNGFSIKAIDTLCSNLLQVLGFTVSGGYFITIGNPAGYTDIAGQTDIYVRFNLSTANIGVGWLYVMQLLFDRVCTVPQVQLSIS